MEVGGKTLKLYYFVYCLGLWQNNADMVFGVLTIVCGIVRTVAGGYVLDKMNSTISKAFKATV